MHYFIPTFFSQKLMVKNLLKSRVAIVMKVLTSFLNYTIMFILINNEDLQHYMFLYYVACLMMLCTCTPP